MATVLLVDDDPDQLAMRRLVLEACGHPVTVATTAVEAEQRFSGQDVIVMDLRIPRVEDGLSLIRALNRSARIIVLSGDPSIGDLEVDMQLQKPCASEKLIEAIVKLSCKPVSK